MLEQIIDAAIGRKKAEIVLKNGRFVNVFTGEICEGDIAIEGGKIVGFGKYEGETEYDIAGKIAVPGLIDAHVHIESSQLSPEEFARLVLPRGEHDAHGARAVVAEIDHVSFHHELIN